MNIKKLLKDIHSIAKDGVNLVNYKVINMLVQAGKSKLNGERLFLS